MIAYHALASYHERYHALTGVPLRVVLTVRSHLVNRDPLNLDNLLARAVVMDATAGRGLPDSHQPYDLPLPLRCLWRDEEGLPLWAATTFRAVSEDATDVSYWHKRVQTGAWTGVKSGRLNIAGQNGRWMERRVPLQTSIAESWEATAIGEPVEVARLLATIPFVGKRRSCGFGEVISWEVLPRDSFALVGDGRLLRPLPAAAVALLDGRAPDAAPAPIGWTPPQWKPSLFRPGWWTGTPVG